MATDARRCRGVLKGVTVCTVGSEPSSGSLSDRVLIAENYRAANETVWLDVRHCQLPREVDAELPEAIKPTDTDTVGEEQANAVRELDPTAYLALKQSADVEARHPQPRVG